MPFKDPEERREYQKELMRKRREDPKQQQYDREYSQRNRHVFNNSIRNARDKTKQWLLDYKALWSCIECGERDPHKLDYHHVDPSTKIESISRILQMYPCQAGIDKALEEMKKCILLCESCHNKKSVGRRKEWGIREDARRYPLARCLYMAHWARQDKKVGGY